MNSMATNRKVKSVYDDKGVYVQYVTRLQKTNKQTTNIFYVHGGCKYLK